MSRQQLVKLEMNTLNVMLGTLNLVKSVGCRRAKREPLKLGAGEDLSILGSDEMDL